MRSRMLRILMLAWLAAWFVLVVPLHQRGMVSRPGMKATEGDSCCAKPEPQAVVAAISCHEEAPVATERSPKKQNTSDPVKRCEVCFIVATMSPPVTIDLTIPKLGLIDEIEVAPRVERCVTVQFWPVVFGRAPPVSA